MMLFKIRTWGAVAACAWMLAGAVPAGASEPLPVGAGLKPGVSAEGCGDTAVDMEAPYDFSGAWVGPPIFNGKKIKYWFVLLEGLFPGPNGFDGNPLPKGILVHFYLSPTATACHPEARLLKIRKGKKGKLQKVTGSVMPVKIKGALKASDATGKYLIAVVNQDNIFPERHRVDNHLPYGPFPDPSTLPFGDEQ